MKHIALIVLALAIYGQCYSQSHYPKTSDKTITTSADTLTITGNDNIAVRLHLFNTSTTDTLKWRTELESTWALIPPRMGFSDVVYAKKIFRKMSGGTGAFILTKID